MNERPIIIPVASGKGGVGKTLVSVNLSFALAQLGKKTVLVDLDFGGANIHTIMGYKSAPDGIGNFLNQKSMNLADYQLTTAVPNLKVIPGDAEMVGIANITSNQKRKLINHLYKLDADYIILDLGAGSTFNTIDFFMLSSMSIIVAVPEITSILNAYAMLKNTIFRLLFVELKKYDQVKELFTVHMKKGGESAWKIRDLMNKLFDIDPEIQAEASSIVDSLNPKIIINMATKPNDVEMGEKLRKISEDYLSIEMEYLGFLYRDKDVNKSVKMRKPLALLSPANQTFQTIVRMAYKITSAKRFPYFLLDINNYDDSLDVLLEEASDDMTGRIQGYNELVDENLLTVNELISLVKNLEYENIDLKKKVKSLEEKLKLQKMKK